MTDKDRPDTDILRRLRETEAGRRLAEEARRLAEQEAAKRKERENRCSG